MLNVLFKYKGFYFQTIMIAAALAIIAGFLNTLEIAEQVSLISRYLFHLSVIVVFIAGGFAVGQLIEISYLKFRRKTDSSLINNCNVFTVENYLIGIFACNAILSVLALLGWLFKIS